MGYLALTVVFAIVSSFFGLWQWDRRGQAVAAINVLEANWDREPDELGSTEGLSPSRDQWTPVLIRGEYEPQDQMLVRTRPRGGQVGFEVLVPLRSETGLTVVVNRGWIPTGESTDFPDLVPEAPTGEVSVVARIKPGEPTLRGRGAPEGQLPSIDLAAMEEALGYDIETEFFLLLDSESPQSAVAPLPAWRLSRSWHYCVKKHGKRPESYRKRRERRPTLTRKTPSSIGRELRPKKSGPDIRRSSGLLRRLA
jgi:cytochrome oxidase assembly protein ShyY1